MAITKTSIQNAALIRIGEKILQGQSATGKAKRIVDEMYDLAIDAAYYLPVNWHFASTRKELGLHDPTSPAFGWDYMFDLPAGNIRVIAMVDEQGDNWKYDFDQELYVNANGREFDVLLCNEPECRIRYIYKRLVPATWPAYFRELVILNLALRSITAITAKDTYNSLYREYKQAFSDAKGVNAKLNDRVNLRGQSKYDEGNTDVISAANVASDFYYDDMLRGSLRI